MFWGVAMSVSSVFAAESFVLENEFVRFEVDSGGKLVSLKNKSSGAEYAGNRDLWRIIYSKADSLENEWLPSDADVKVSKPSSDKISLSYGGIFPVNIDCSLDGKQVLLKPSIKNSSKDLVLREFQFPLIKNFPSPEKYKAIWSYSGGGYASNAGKTLKKWVDDAKTAYMAEDYNAVERSLSGRARTQLHFCGKYRQQGGAVHGKLRRILPKNPTPIQGKGGRRQKKPRN